MISHRPGGRRDRRSDMLARMFASDARDPMSVRRRHNRGVFVGWLVLMTIWGFGRALIPGLAGLFLWLGLISGAVTAYVIGWKAPSAPRADPPPGLPDESP